MEKRLNIHGSYRKTLYRVTIFLRNVEEKISLVYPQYIPSFSPFSSIYPNFVSIHAPYRCIVRLHHSSFTGILIITVLAVEAIVSGAESPWGWDTMFACYAVYLSFYIVYEKVLFHFYPPDY